jgi:hypothetical protein
VRITRQNGRFNDHWMLIPLAQSLEGRQRRVRGTTGGAPNMTSPVLSSNTTYVYPSGTGTPTSISTNLVYTNIVTETTTVVSLSP